MSQLAAWGGRDEWQYVWESQLQDQLTPLQPTWLKVNPANRLIQFNLSSSNNQEEEDGEGVSSLRAEINLENVSSERIVYKVESTLRLIIMD